MRSEMVDGDRDHDHCNRIIVIDQKELAMLDSWNLRNPVFSNDELDNMAS